MARPRLFAGAALQKLRATHALRQLDLAETLAISASYLSQLENDARPLTQPLIERLARAFPLDWQEIDAGTTERLAVAMREASADPLFREPLASDQLERFVEQQPVLAERFVALHDAYRAAGERLAALDEALSTEHPGGGQLPWEEVRDWFHLANNYVDDLDRAAEALAQRISASPTSPGTADLEACLRTRHKVSLSYRPGRLRDYDAAMRHLELDSAQPPESRRFQLAHQLVALEFADEILALASNADLRSPAARKLLAVGLSNYAAGALLMPYGRFRRQARRLRHDIDRLRLAFDTSFEQTCHRLSTLQRHGERGVPFFFCRVDMAGNITKRHSATRLQFARFGGACPLWIVHEAVAIPDRILVQLAETPDGVRYVSMAKGLVKPSDSFQRAPRRYAVALGCEAADAAEFIYADGLDAGPSGAATPIGNSCRICPRAECEQRAFPPSDRGIAIDPDSRGIVPYRIA